MGSTHQWVLIRVTGVEYLVWGIDWQAMIGTYARVLVGMMGRSTYLGVLIGVPMEEWLVLACGVYLRECKGADDHPSNSCLSEGYNLRLSYQILNKTLDLDKVIIAIFSNMKIQ